MSLKLPGGIGPLAQASRQVRVEAASKSYLPSADSGNAYARQLDKQAVRLGDVAILGRKASLTKARSRCGTQ